MRFEHHLFICTNQRTEGDCCAGRGSLDILKTIKHTLRTRGLDHEGGIMANKSGCFGLCQQGPNVVVYPQGTWHRIHNPQEAIELIDALTRTENQPPQGNRNGPDATD
jgi:(2Fe-2S) ferredoxin